MRELSRLKHQIDLAAGGSDASRRVSLGDIALVQADEEVDEPADGDDRPRAGVAPTGD